MSKPNKILQLLGYNNLGLILEQERKHWLMKTDKNKQNQDKNTGDVFQGQIDNIATDIIIESKKLPYSYGFIKDITFSLEHADEILDISNSSFPHSAEVNGLCMAVIKSINYRLTDSDHHNYKIRFNNCTECIIPFGISKDTEGVFATRWIVTTTPPTLLVADNDQQYTIERTLSFDSTIVSNPVWYYPLDESLQPIDVTKSNDSYTSEAIDDNGLIGYPLFWFICDNSAVGINVSFTNNLNHTIYVGNDGNETPYDCKIYTDIDGTPDGSIDTYFNIYIHPSIPNTFTGNITRDINIPLSNVVTFENTTNSNTYDITIHAMYKGNDTDKTITMNGDISNWVYVNDNAYKIAMDVFTVNRIDNVNPSTLLHMLNMKLDNSIPFVKHVSDEGVSGIRLSSSNLKSDKYGEYPLNLNKLDGLPEWMNNLDDDIVPEHLIAYAYHFPPSYDPSRPSTMQGAGLIADPGKISNNPSNPDSIGRVYVLSNDDTEYHNNANEDEYVKPPLTAARICDIPTSIFDLNGVRGVSTDPIVDDRYVRTECSFSVEDKDRIYNTLQSKWVRPTAFNNENVRVNEANDFDGVFAFDGIDMLNQVDMYNELNPFRVKTNLNPMVDVTKISTTAYVNEMGIGYAVNDTCVCIVGGYSFTVEITAVTPDGAVTAATVVIDGTSTDKINLNNFNDVEGNISGPYNTSPTNGSTGTGLSIYFHFEPGYLDTIRPSLGEFYTDLFALVREHDGLWTYVYSINTSSIAIPKPGTWKKDMLLSPNESSTTIKSEGGLSVKDSYLNSIIPSIRELPVSMKMKGVNEASIKVVQTGSMLTVIDTEHTPVAPRATSEDPIELERVVDICKWYSDGMKRVSIPKSGTRTIAEVFEYLESINELRYDSYVIWRWSNPNSNTDHTIEYAIVHRGFNNLFTTDSTTLLPSNELNCDNFVHLNNQTTLVWNVPGVGPMTWIYDPTYTKREIYYFNPETMELHVERKDAIYNDIDFVDNFSSDDIVVTEERGGIRPNYNIYSNNPHAFNYINRTNVIYQQPKMTEIYSKDGYVIDKQLCGNWRLVFPRVNSYTFENDDTNTHWIPTKLQLIKGNVSVATGSDTKVTDEDGHDITTKNIVFNETEEGMKLQIFNTETGVWEEIKNKQ